MLIFPAALAIFFLGFACCYIVLPDNTSRFLKWAFYAIFCYAVLILPLYLDGFLEKGIHKTPIRVFTLVITGLSLCLLIAQFKIKKFFRTGGDSMSENQTIYPGALHATGLNEGRQIYGLGQVMNVF